MKKCSKCNTANPEKAQFCQECGAELVKNHPKKSINEKKGKDNKKNNQNIGIIIGSAFFVLILIAILSAISYNNSNIINVPENITENDVGNQTIPLALDYNKSKGSQTDSITIKGKVLLYQSYDSPYFGLDSNSIMSGNGNTLANKAPGTLINSSGFSPDTNITIFVSFPESDIYVGQWRYVDSGNIVSGYKKVTDVIVIYWPEKKVVGWHKVYGSEPESKTYGYDTGSAEDKFYGDDRVNEWIYSLPIES